MKFRNVTYEINTPNGASAVSMANPDFDQLYQLQPNNTMQCLEAVSRIDNLVDIEKFIKSIAKLYGFSFYTDFTRIRQNSSDQQQFYLIDSETEWTNHYRSNKFYLIDPSFRFLKQTSTPYVWDIDQYSYELKSQLAENEKTVVSSAINFGVTQVAHFPFHNYNSSGLIRFIRFSEKPLSAMERLNFISTVYLPLHLLYEKKFNLLKGKTEYDNPHNLLSSREKEVLTWYATGTSTPQISGRLRISEHTVRNHLRNIRQKLGVRTIAQAIAKAIEADLILIL